jgi:protein-tyrosine phosphatase
VAPFSVLHLCMGNICRSPIAERLTVLAARNLVGDKADELLHVHSAGTGGWHVGEPMYPSASRLVLSRGGSVDGFACRRLSPDDIESSDLILTATAEQQRAVVSRRADAADRTFVLGEFGRLLPSVALDDLPPFAPAEDAVYARGCALVAAVDALRGGLPPRPADDLDDPWGYPDETFARVADEIEATVRPLVSALLPRRS